MIFGMMAAVSQDLPAIYNFAQYKASKNSEVVDDNGEPIGTLTCDQNKILLSSAPDLPQHQERGGLDRGLPLLRTQRRRLPGHRPRPGQGHPQPERPAGRLDDHRAVRQERARSRRQPHGPGEVPRGGARLQARAALDQGQDPHRVPEHDLLRRGRLRDRGRRPHLLRRRPPRLRDPAEPCASVLEPWEAATLAAIIASPSAFDPKVYPENALGRRNLVLEKMYEQGYISHEQYEEGIKQALPSPSDIKPPTLRLQGPLLHRLPAPAAGRTLRRLEGLLRRPQSQVDARPAAAGSGRRSGQLLPRLLAGDRLGGRDRQPQRRHQGDGRRPRLRNHALQPGDPGPPPAGLLDQAVHAADRAGRGDLAGNGLRIGRRRPSTSARTARKSSKSTTTRTPTSAPARSSARRPTPTTRSTPSSASKG